MAGSRDKNLIPEDVKPPKNDSFDLIIDPWLDCVFQDGSKKTMGIRGVLADAHEINALAFDDPMQDPAVFRTLLAVLYRALDPLTVDDWKAIWSSGRLPSDRLDAYFDSHADDFWLHGASKSFMQTMSAEPNSALKPLSSLIPTPTGLGTMFPNVTGDAANKMSCPQLARWVITCNSYDRCAAHSGFKGDPEMRNGISYASMPYLGQLAVVRLKTSSLFRDLMLALVPLDSGFFTSMQNEPETVDDLYSPTSLRELSAGVPSWEKPDLTPGHDGTAKSKLTPDTVEDCLTWRSRRIKVYYDGDGEGEPAQVLLSPGQHVTLEDQQGLEPMAAWRARQEKKDSPVHWAPVRYSADKAFWRGLSPLLAATSSTIPPMTLRWASKLCDDGILPAGYVGHVTVETCRYDSSMSSLVTDFLVDKVDLPLKIVNDLKLTRVVTDAVSLAENAVRAYGLMVQRQRVASGEDMETANAERQTRQSIAYRTVGDKFMEWLPQVASMDSPLLEWWEIMSRNVKDMAEDYVHQATPNAMVGKMVGKTLYSAAAARMTFYASMNAMRKEINETTAEEQ